MLKLPDTNSKFHIAAMFVISNIPKLINTKFRAMFMINLRTTLHMPSYNSSLLLAMRRKAKFIFHMLLFHFP